jgi:DNA-binding transcriptional ArsR family regulator
MLVLVCRIARAASYFGVENTIEDNLINVQITVLTDEELFEFKVFGNVRNLTSNADCKVADRQISCKRLNTTSINIRFQSDSFLEFQGNVYKFYQQFLLPSINRVTSLITLPVGHVVANTSDAVYPKKYSMLSNGRNILVYWEMENVSTLQPLAFQVYYQPLEIPEKKDYSLLYALAVIAISLFAFALVYIRRTRAAKKEIKPEKVVLKVLDKYERKVFEIVKKAGSIKQGKIVELAELSKAKVSRVVKSLEEKGLLKSERRGRTKIVRLKKKLLG